MARKRRKSIRKYRTKNQKAALAAALFGGVFTMIIVMIYYSASMPLFHSKQQSTHQAVLLSEAYARINK